MALLNVHYYVGFAVVLLALVAVWRKSDRRITLWVVTLQIAIGIALVVQGLKAPSLHYALGTLGWIGYMTANGLAKRPERRGIVLAITAVSTLLIVYGFYVGMHAVKTGAAG